ncbi:MAG: class I SAM-dependent rRNA methyltransferase [Pirellulaceae bacterium]
MLLQNTTKPIHIALHKDLKRAIKRGHAWLYSDAIDLRPAASGSVALLHDRKDEIIACGIYDASHPIPLRVCRTQPPFILDDAWVASQLSKAIALRQLAFDPTVTNGYRIVAGEGDGLPGLIIDLYDRTAVIKLDGGAPEAFYRPQGLADWLRDNLQAHCVVLRTRQRGRVGEALVGTPPEAPVEFLENGLIFSADVLQGQKTGFFLDQRDNRALIQSLSRGRSVLNLFSFNGGFSVAAGRGGASDVTSVDLAAPAIAAASTHWEMNQLQQPHHAVVQDCFEFLQSAIRGRENWDLVICDPPSFAPSEKTRQQGLTAYTKLAQLAAQVTRPGGMLALASCSSHVGELAFTQANLDGLGRARRQATVLSNRSLPIDHPTPMAMPELRYLKFQLLQLDA